MAKIKERTISWEPANAPDLSGYKVYWEKIINSGDIATYDSDFQDVSNVTTISLPNDITGSLEWDGDYSIGITAYDATGNESDMSYGTSFFDFVAPPAPGLVTIV